MRGSAPLLAALALAATALPARAVEDYDACLALVAENPARAEIESSDWSRFGGGSAARHCHAMALAALGATRLAAEELAALARDARDLPNAIRAEALLQAAEFLLDLGETGAGIGLAEQAIRLDDSAEARTMRARLHAAEGNYARALADLDAAVAAAPTADRVLLRASARRQEGRLQEARADAVWALELSPDLPIAFLELGEIEAAAGRKNPARDAFLKAIELDRGGDIAAAARLSLQRMEAG